jgi:uncharacterized protein (TIGR02266 family)
MVDQRRDKRAPASLKVKYKSANVDQFIQQFGTDVSRGGMFIKTKTPLEMGTLLKLELQLSDASPVIQGMGRVCWRRVTSTDASFPAGMGLKFVKLEDQSRITIERIVSQRGGAPSRFDQTAGAEVSNEPDEVESSAPPPATSAAPRPASPAAAAALPRAAAPKPAAPPAASPRAAAPRPAVAGLFAHSAIASQPPEPPPEGGARSSFFPPAPSTEAKPASPRAAGPAGAFGSAKAAPAPTPAAPARPADDEEAAFDRLFDEVQRGKSSAPPSAAPAPAAPAPAASRVAASPSPVPAAAAPVSEMDDVFGALGEEEGLRSVPPQKPVRSSAPDSAAEALAALAAPERASSPGRVSSPGLTVPMGDDDDDFGEADIGGGVSAPPPPVASLRPGAAAHDVAAAPEKRSALPWILVLLLLVGAGGAYLYYQRMLAEQAARAVEREASAAVEPPAVAEALPGAGGPAAAGAGVGIAGAAAAPAVAAPSEPTTPAVPVQVEVTSVPRGADLVVGDARVGMTPMRVELPIGRPANVSVRSQGFATETRTVIATPNQEPLRFKLEPLAYVLFVRTEPAEAELELGAQKVIAPGPLELGHLDGGIVVSISKPGHQRMTRPVRLEEFTERDGKMRGEIDVRLSPLPGFKGPVVAPKPPAPKPRSRPSGRKPAASAAPAPAAEGEPAAAAPAAPATPAPPTESPAPSAP